MMTIDMKMVRLLLPSILLVLGVTRMATSSSVSHYVKVDLSGTLPIIISAPHGGSLKPTDIPDRRPGCYDPDSKTCTYSQDCTLPRNDTKCPITTVKDLMTENLADLLVAELTESLGASPKFVISKIHRTKVDFNRERAEAACGHPKAEQVYDLYQDSLRQARMAIQGPGLLLDVHGHSRPEQWAMLGYLISSSNLKKPDLELEDLANTSSIRHLASQSDYSFLDLLRGSPASLGDMFEEEGLKAVPSPTNPDSGSAKRYYSGQHIIRAHGSRDGGTVDAIQLEIHKVNRTPKTNRVAFSQALAKVITRYYRTHYGGEGSTSISMTHKPLPVLVIFIVILLQCFKL